MNNNKKAYIFNDKTSKQIYFFSKLITYKNVIRKYALKDIKFSPYWKKTEHKRIWLFVVLFLNEAFFFRYILNRFYFIFLRNYKDKMEIDRIW